VVPVISSLQMGGKLGRHEDSGAQGRKTINGGSGLMPEKGGDTSAKGVVSYSIQPTLLVEDEGPGCNIKGSGEKQPA